MQSKTADYALRAVVCMAIHPGQTDSASELAKLTHVPRRYLHKVLQGLVQQGLIKSQPGPGGGYSLKKSPDEITILDVVNAVAPIERIRECPLKFASQTALCPLHEHLDNAYATMHRYMSHVTITQLLRSTNPRKPFREVRNMEKTIPLLFSCSGCSNAGQLANTLALELDRRGRVEMCCLAGVGAGKPFFLKKLRGREVWVIDGCPIECSLGVFECIRDHVDVQIRLHDFGVRKHDPLPTEENFEQLFLSVLDSAAQQRGNAATSTRFPD